MLKRLYTHMGYVLAIVNLALYLLTGQAKAQDFEFGRLTMQDSAINIYTPQPAANGLILQEFGNLYYKKEWPYNLVHLYHIKVKIFKPEALEYGNIKISYQKWADGKKESIENLEAVVFKPDGTGGYKKTQCDFLGFRTDENKYHNVFIYAMPNVTVGSIIEYRYELETPARTDFTPWMFQNGVPALHSEYHVHMPEILSYKVTLTGDHSLSKNNIKTCPLHTSIKCSHMVYAMDSVAAFEPEERMVNIKNYVPALYFNRVDYTYNSRSRYYTMKTWASLDAELIEDEYFGGVLKKTDYFKRKLKDIIAQNADTLDKARSIYTYVNHNIKPATTITSAKKAFTKGKGNMIEINLILATALNAYGIKASPVLLSTRNNGEINKDLPDINAFDYMVVKTHINNRDIYLDATDPLLPFGTIPDECYNNNGRVISITDSCYWVKMRPAYKANKNYIIDLTLKTDGSIAGKVKCYYGGYSAYVKRKEIKSYTTTDEYREKIITKNNRVKILNVTVNAVDSVDATLWEAYDIEVSRSINNTGNKVFFNPYIFDLIADNPFKSTDRIYPVDVGAASDERFVLTLHLPENVQIENQPQTTALALPGNGGMFVTAFSMLDNTAMFSHMLQLNRSVYTPDEYPHLKELFNKIIQAQKADVILKSKI